MILDKKKHLAAPVITLLLGLLVSLPTLRFYAQVNGMWLSYMAMLLLPLFFYIKTPGDFSLRFGGLVGACLVVFYFIPSHLILLFGFYSFSFLVVEIFLGKLNKLAFVLMILASPIAYYLFEVFGFPIRLTLTNWAAAILNLFGLGCQSQGNVLEIGNNTFSVDPVCMGLNMVMTSMVGSMIMISFFEKKRQQVFSNTGLGLSLISALSLVVFSNLIRIILIVIFAAEPESFLHEAIGLIALVVGVFIPLYFLLFSISKIFSKPLAKKENKNTVKALFKTTLLPTLLLGLFIANQSHTTIAKEQLDAKAKQVDIESYQKKILNFAGGEEVLQYQFEEKLIYIKSQHPYRITNHNPLICWQGSGYEIKNENTLEVGEYQVIFAELVSKKDKYFTAWWFDNGKYKTIGNLDWRWQVLQGAPHFYLINVSAKDFSSLYMEVNYLIEQQLF